jgi:hypothetical protein
VVVQATFRYRESIVQAENIKQLLMGKIKTNFNGKGFRQPQRQSSIDVLLMFVDTTTMGKRFVACFSSVYL